MPEAACAAPLNISHVVLTLSDCYKMEKRQRWEAKRQQAHPRVSPWPWWQLLTFLSLADQEIKILSAGCLIKWVWYAPWAFKSPVTAPPVSTTQANSSVGDDDYLHWDSPLCSSLNHLWKLFWFKCHKWIYFFKSVLVSTVCMLLAV